MQRPARFDCVDCANCKKPTILIEETADDLQGSVREGNESNPSADAREWDAFNTMGTSHT